MPDGWGLSEWGNLGTVGALIISIGGIWHSRGRKDEAITAMGEKVKIATEKADAVARDLSAFKEKAAGEFIPRGQFAEMEGRIFSHLDRLGERFDGAIAKLGERIDRIAEK